MTIDTKRLRRNLPFYWGSLAHDLPADDTFDDLFVALAERGIFGEGDFLKELALSLPQAFSSENDRAAYIMRNLLKKYIKQRKRKASETITSKAA